jgi:hypothetical protein
MAIGHGEATPYPYTSCAGNSDGVIWLVNLSCKFFEQDIDAATVFVLFSACPLILFYWLPGGGSWVSYGQVIYIDASQWEGQKPFYDPELRLTGKPDYLVEHGNQVIPVEVKSRRAPQSPYDSHIYQLAAYCLLVEHAFGIRPSQGFIHYADRTFEIEYTHALEASIKGIIQEMRGHTTLTVE